MLHEVARTHAPPYYASSKVTPLEAIASQKASNAPEFTTPETSPIAVDNERTNGTDRVSEGGSDLRQNLVTRGRDTNSCRVDADCGGGSKESGQPLEGGEGNLAGAGEQRELQGIYIGRERAAKNVKLHTDHVAEQLGNGEFPHHPVTRDVAVHVYWELD